MAHNFDSSIPLLDFEKASLGSLYDSLSKLKQQQAPDDDVKEAEEAVLAATKTLYKGLNNWEVTQVARHPNRPYALDYVGRLFDGFVEIHGDRRFGDDQAIVCGLARLKEKGTSCVLVLQQKGRSTEEKIRRNFGMPQPEGYRKALRLFGFAEKFKKPVVTFIDTPGAFPGTGGEERGQAEAIAQNLKTMSGLGVPIVSVVIGEGGSGGALGIGVANRVLMLEHAIYSVISPESCASILWRNPEEKVKAALALKNDARTAKRFGVVDELIKEPVGGAHRDPDLVATRVGKELSKALESLKRKSPRQLAEERFEKYSTIGEHTFAAEPTKP